MSSTDQNLARQIATLDEVHRLFKEKQSGARRDGRIALAETIACARKRDTVVRLLDGPARTLSRGT